MILGYRKYNGVFSYCLVLLLNYLFTDTRTEMVLIKCYSVLSTYFILAELKKEG